MADSARAKELRAQMEREKREAAARDRDAKVRDVLERATMTAATVIEERVDGELKRLEEVENMGDEELEELRARRLEQMKRSRAKAEELRAAGHGAYTSCADEKEFIEHCKRSDRLVVHFGRAATWRCEILDGHLAKLAASHLETKFIKVDAEKNPALSERLLIHALPSMVLVKKGKTNHTIVGFGEMGGDDNFPTSDLERVLGAHGVIDVSSAPSSAAASAAARQHHAQGSLSVRRGGAKLTDDWVD